MHQGAMLCRRGDFLAADAAFTRAGVLGRQEGLYLYWAKNGGRP